MTHLLFDPGSTSISLIERLKSNEPEAWPRFLNIYGPVIFDWCRFQYRLDEATAEEIGQRVLVKAYEGIPGFEHRSFRGWLRTITLNAVRDFKRREHERATGGSDNQVQLANIQAPRESPAEVAAEATSMYRRAIESIRGRFKDTVWQAFWRMEIDGQTSTSIAEELGITDSGVRYSRLRVLAYLRTDLKGLLELDGDAPRPD